MFWNAWKPNQQAIPTAATRPNRSPASRAIRSERHSSTANSATTTAAPTRPNSSPATVKTKSVCCSGTNPACVWVPSNNPWPVMPPLPIAMRACWVLYPAPRGSSDGSVKAANRSSWYDASRPDCTARTTTAAPPPASSSSQRFGAPDSPTTPKTVAVSTISVPRSGCARMSTAGTAAIASAGSTSTAFTPCRRCASERSASTKAIPRTTPNLASSAGCSESPPISSQDCDSLMVAPTPGTNTRTSPSTDAP